MTDEEREAAKVRAIDILECLETQINEAEAGIPEACRQTLFEGKDLTQVFTAVGEALVTREVYSVVQENFTNLVSTDSEKNNRHLFFEALDQIKQKKVVTAHDIDWLDDLVILSDQVTQDALIELKQRVAH